MPLAAHPGSIETRLRSGSTDGHTFLGDATEGFSPLTRFGTDFCNHFVAKMQKGLALQDLMFARPPSLKLPWQLCSLFI